MRDSTHRSRHVDGARVPVSASMSFSKLRIALYTLMVGIFAGTQIYNPNKRAIEAAAGLILVFILWNGSCLGALWMLFVLYPFPFAISLGDSNIIFLILTFIIYLIRVSAGKDEIHSDPLVNMPIILLFSAYVLSFYNLDPNPSIMRSAYINTISFFGAILLYYLMINSIDSEEKLIRTLKILMISVAFIITFTILELLFPGRTIIPNWLYTTHKVGLITRGIRVGGPFHDFELMAEFYAINALIIFFLLIRSRRLLTRAIFTALLLADLFTMFTTITRGAFISLAIAGMYMIFISRRDLTIVRLVAFGTLFVGLAFFMDAFVTKYTVSGSLFDRILKTTFEKGIIPSNRLIAWGGSLKRAMENPIIGHGPGWDFTKSIDIRHWPHNVYLYFLNITGLLGLSSFLFLIFRFMKATLRGFKASLITSPFPVAFMKILHVCLVLFLIDQIKIDYARNNTYSYFIWIFFGLIGATRLIIEKSRETAHAAAS
jgi:hypothetical protein